MEKTQGGVAQEAAKRAWLEWLPLEPVRRSRRRQAVLADALHRKTGAAGNVGLGKCQKSRWPGAADGEAIAWLAGGHRAPGPPAAPAQLVACGAAGAGVTG